MGVKEGDRLRFTNEFQAFLQAAVQDGEMEASYDAPIADLFTMQVGGRAALLLAPRRLACLCRLLRLCHKEDFPYYLIGNGSNTVFGNRYFGGAVITTRSLQNVEICGTKITADCGASLNQLIVTAARQGLCGMEMLYGIPGTVGGAIRMNAGAHGGDIAACLARALLLSPSSGRARWFSRTELAFSYRNSLLQQAPGLLMLRAEFALHRDEPATIKARMADVVRARRLSQPLELPSAGSAFRRPLEGEVWRMVDRCGLRGHAIGGAAVSEKHAGFIVNRGGATAMDVCRLVGLIHARVQQTCGVSLVPEIEFLHVSEEEKCLLPIP